MTKSIAIVALIAGLAVNAGLAQAAPSDTHVKSFFAERALNGN